MQPSFVKKLYFYIQKINVDIQKIDGSRFETFGMVVASFLIYDKNGKFQFFKETFLWADISMDIVNESFLTTRQIELVGKKEFVVIALELDNEISIIHIVFLISLNLGQGLTFL